MDWIFLNDNAQQVLTMLGAANPTVLKKKSIKHFINLMWSHYQSAIIRWIFLPYVAYLVFLSQLTGAVAAEYLAYLYEDRTDPDVHAAFLFV